MIKIIIINGTATSGKNTFIAMVNELYPGRIFEHSTVDTPKKITKTFLNIDPKTQKSDAERRLWSDLKDALTRYNDFPFKETVELIENIQDYYKRRGIKNPNAIIFVHVREPEEIKKLADYYSHEINNFTTVLIERNVGHIPDNHADENVKNYPYEFIIQNNGSLDDLRQTAKNFIENYC